MEEMEWAKLKVSRWVQETVLTAMVQENKV